MNLLKFGFYLFFICIITFSFHTASSLAVSNFPDTEGQTKDLIAKIYSVLIPLKARKDGNQASLYPGQLYDVGGDLLHLFCMGVSKPGAPTILLESGVGSSSTEWIPIQRTLSKYTQVCAYDRVGYGWSEEWSSLKSIESLLRVLPRTIDHHVETLERLLTKSQISRPIILVGHSYGGPISLAFEAKYPNQISGLVLLDPHDDGIAREDSNYTDEIARDIKRLEDSKSPASKIKWESQLKEIASHLAEHQNGKVQDQVLAQDLSVLVNSLDPMKWYRALWSEWRGLHSSCAKIKAHPSKTLSHKALTVISSDPTHKNSEGQSYLHMKIAKLSNQGKFYLALRSGHDIPADRPDLTIKAVVDALEGKAKVKAILPHLNKPTRFFVDGDLANYVRDNTQHKEKHKKLSEFCRQLRMGFKTYTNFGYTDDHQTGIMGYYVVCN